MDDFNVVTLRQCTNELCSRMMNIISPLILEGIRSIFDESWKMCHQQKEESKYLMTFQNLLSRVPRWNQTIIDLETSRIIERSGCNHLEDLITCVHIVQLKSLTAIRVANKMKKIDISIPKINDFIHKVYIHTARKLYSNVYLFERSSNGTIEMQKNNREIELVINQCILNAIRDSIPIENILQAYLAPVETEDTEHGDGDGDGQIDGNGGGGSGAGDGDKGSGNEGGINDGGNSVIAGNGGNGGGNDGGNGCGNGDGNGGGGGGNDIINEIVKPSLTFDDAMGSHIYDSEIGQIGSGPINFSGGGGNNNNTNLDTLMFLDNDVPSTAFDEIVDLDAPSGGNNGGASSNSLESLLNIEEL